MIVAAEKVIESNKIAEAEVMVNLLFYAVLYSLLTKYSGCGFCLTVDVKRQIFDSYLIELFVSLYIETYRVRIFLRQMK